MLFFVAFVAGGAVGLVCGGRLRNLRNTHLRWPILPLVLFFAEAALSFLGRAGYPGMPLFTVWVLVMACLVFWALANCCCFGMGLVASGVILNLVTVVANIGMPVSKAALWRVYGYVPHVSSSRLDYAHVLMTSRTHLKCFSDVIPLASPIWARGILSFGDLLLAFGLAAAAYALIHQGELVLGQADVTTKSA